MRDPLITHKIIATIPMNPVTKSIFADYFLIFALFFGFQVANAQIQTVTTAPIRGVWVAGPQHNLFWQSPQTMDREMAAFKSTGINTVYLAALNHGRTHYPSAVMQQAVGAAIAPQFAGRDPLSEAIAAGAAHGIRVIAWLEFGFASHHGKSGHASTLLSAHPGWAALNRQGQPLVKNEFHWMNAFDPEVQTFVTSLCTELARNYPSLSGIQGDDRLPAQPVEGGHNPAVVAAFVAATGKPLPANDRDPEWTQWRADQLTTYFKSLRSALKSVRSDFIVSSAPSPYPWGFQEYLQDWPAWMRLGLVDEIIPQLYRREAAGYGRLLKQTHGLMMSNLPATKAPNMATGVLLSLGQNVVNSPEVVADMVKANRAIGINGEVFFHSIGLTTATTAPSKRPDALP